MTDRIILERRPLPSRGGTVEAEIVLCKLPHNTVTPYVTWQRNVADGECYWGHYHRDLAEAAADYQTRGH